MSDYTPTTEDIQRLVYECGSLSTVKITWEDFNAWLAEVKAEQDKATTDRIIALLEDEGVHKECLKQPLFNKFGRERTCIDFSHYCTTTLDIITLIKGEEK